MSFGCAFSERIARHREQVPKLGRDLKIGVPSGKMRNDNA
jgi:hypothetical protein